MRQRQRQQLWARCEKKGNNNTFKPPHVSLGARTVYLWHVKVELASKSALSYLATENKAQTKFQRTGIMILKDEIRGYSCFAAPFSALPETLKSETYRRMKEWELASVRQRCHCLLTMSR